ncbi:hypothetical protein [Candidatus Xenohaliotis californiensis]|uniref:hypothetical protein n=1 Tax=Candidatus Xenohaliotis californiensis TaxID=84677 RepID=UPI0030C7EFFB
MRLTNSLLIEPVITIVLSTKLTILLLTNALVNSSLISLKFVVFIKTAVEIIPDC